ncbi:4-oxalocrotonate tautomerase family protein [Phenylobacterium sp.]|uniref:tautomerase family protein n=1 Tax=Phenylobacterium sp. TaxID=1871053 RepID=UPI00286E3211|nr:4-oxalocrotonate tautomerase family protein [Phenylobacterium sp.]
MPYVNIRITPGATQAQKEELIAGATELLVKVLNKNPQTTFVVIGEVEREHWDVGGQSIAARDKA